MANTVRLLYSNTASNTPSSLGNGVIAVNQADGKLFYRASNGTVTQLATGSGGGASAYSGTSSFPATGSSSTLYLDTSSNRLYRWDSTGNYVEIGTIGGIVDADGGSY